MKKIRKTSFSVLMEIVERTTRRGRYSVLVRASHIKSGLIAERTVAVDVRRLRGEGLKDAMLSADEMARNLAHNELATKIIGREAVQS